MSIDILNESLGMKDVMDEELSQPKFDQEFARKHANKLRGNPRIPLGKFYTPEQWEEKRERLEKQPLP